MAETKSKKFVMKKPPGDAPVRKSWEGTFSFKDGASTLGDLIGLLQNIDLPHDHPVTFRYVNVDHSDCGYDCYASTYDECKGYLLHIPVTEYEPEAAYNKRLAAHLAEVKAYSTWLEENKDNIAQHLLEQEQKRLKQLERDKKLTEKTLRNIEKERERLQTQLAQLDAKMGGL
jgi:hypothetical protein